MHHYTDSGRGVDVEIDGEGDVFGGGKGLAGDRYDMAFCANVKNTNVTIEYEADDTPEAKDLFHVYFDSEENEWQEGLKDAYRNTSKTSTDQFQFILGSVYGGAENGHVIGDARVTLTQGLIGHVVYGGGKGKEKYKTDLWKVGSTSATPDSLNVKIYSHTAGKVYGNTYVTMTGGHVIRNVFGGGNMASVGKGNYAGGTDDYSTGGYGELPENGSAKLWESSFDDTQAESDTNKPDLAYYFLNSGNTNVEIYGGTIGFPNSQKDDMPTGNVFGGCRGIAPPNVARTLTPRWKYCSEFYLGYINQSNVTIGNASGGPTIYGSVYGAGEDGHVRRSTDVNIVKGEIGVVYSTDNIDALKTTYSTMMSESDKAKLEDPAHILWRLRGNVFGGGSG